MNETYHTGMRELQDRYDTRRLADRLDEKLGRTAFTDEDRAFIESRPLFFLATADAQGRPDCSYKGGAAGFVRVTGAERARVSELRRQRHVPQPRQHRRQPGGRAAVHRLRVAEAAARQRRAVDRSTTPTAGARIPRRAARGARARAAHLPELPALHPPQRAAPSSRPTRRAPATRRRSRSGSRCRCSPTCCRARPRLPTRSRRRPRCGRTARRPRAGSGASSRRRPPRIRRPCACGRLDSRLRCQVAW